MFKKIVELWHLSCIIMFKWMNKHPRMQKFWKLCLYYEDIYEQRLNRQGDGLLQHCSQWGKVSMLKPVITFSLFFSTKRSFWTTIFWGLSFYTIWDLLIAYRTMYLRFFKLETLLNNHFKFTFSSYRGISSMPESLTANQN